MPWCKYGRILEITENPPSPKIKKSLNFREIDH